VVHLLIDPEFFVPCPLSPKGEAFAFLFRSLLDFSRGDATQPSFAVGNRRLVFEGQYQLPPGAFPRYDVSPDGQRFLMLKPIEQAQAPPTRINVVLNWFEELKRRVPQGK